MPKENAVLEEFMNGDTLVTGEPAKQTSEGEAKSPSELDETPSLIVKKQNEIEPSEKPGEDENEDEDEDEGEDEGEEKKLDLEDFEKELGEGTEELLSLAKRKLTEEKKDEVTTTERPQSQSKDFDYSSFTIEETKLLKNMSRPAREWAISLLKERRELNQKVKQVETQVAEKQGIHPSFYESEEGYQIIPEFGKIQEIRALASRIVAHWEDQLIKAESGEDFQDLDYDPETKKLVIGETKEASGANKIELRRNLRFAEQQLDKQDSRAQAFVSEFRQNQKKHQEAILGLEKRFFPQFEDPKYKGWELANALLEHLKKTGHDKSPFARALAKSAALNTLLVEHIRNQKAGVDKTKKLAEDAKLAGPGGSKTAQAGKGQSKISVEDFNREMVE